MIIEFIDVIRSPKHLPRVIVLMLPRTLAHKLVPGVAGGDSDSPALHGVPRTLRWRAGVTTGARPRLPVARSVAPGVAVPRSVLERQVGVNSCSKLS